MKPEPNLECSYRAEKLAKSVESSSNMGHCSGVKPPTAVTTAKLLANKLPSLVLLWLVAFSLQSAVQLCWCKSIDVGHSNAAVSIAAPHSTTTTDTTTVAPTSSQAASQLGQSRTGKNLQNARDREVNGAQQLPSTPPASDRERGKSLTVENVNGAETNEQSDNNAANSSSKVRQRVSTQQSASKSDSAELKVQQQPQRFSNGHQNEQVVVEALQQQTVTATVSPPPTARLVVVERVVRNGELTNNESGSANNGLQQPTADSDNDGK